MSNFNIWRLGRRVASSTRFRLAIGLAIALAMIAVGAELARWQAIPTDVPLDVKIVDPELGAASVPSETAVRRFLEERPLTGLTVCVATSDSLSWCAEAGYADLAAGTRLRADKPQRLASASKPVAAALLGRLIDQRVLTLEDRVDRWLSVPPSLAPMTVGQLASHTAGVRGYRWRFGWPPHETMSWDHYPTITDSLEVFADDPAVFEPGTNFEYSSFGYTLLGAAMEAATDTSFEALVQDELAVGAGLETIGLADDSETATVRYYQPAGRWVRAAIAADPSRSWPGAGLQASAADLARLGARFVAGELGARDTAQQLLSERLLPGGESNPQRYAHGWRLGTTHRFVEGGDRIAHHGGTGSGVAALLMTFPDHGLAVATLTNTGVGSWSLTDLTFEVAGEFLALIRR